MKHLHTAVKSLNILKIKVKELDVIRRGLDACLASSMCKAMDLISSITAGNYKEKESKMV